MTRGVIAGLMVLFLLLGAGVLFNYVETQATVRDLAATVASAKDLCQAGNRESARQVTFWSHLVQLVPPPRGETPAARKQREDQAKIFLAYVRQQFRPQDCSAFDLHDLQGVTFRKK